jgi:uncharacterized protein YndB with AHSA1/START domain
MIEPLRLVFEVDCDPSHAFNLWTEGSALWWPAWHTTHKQQGTAVVFEPAAGGRVYELDPSGHEVEWGRIVAWEPPARLVYRWHIFSGSEDATEVEIRFRSNKDGTTTVELEHRGWDAFDDGPDRRERNAIGWRGLVPAYASVCHRPISGSPAPAHERRT